MHPCMHMVNISTSTPELCNLLVHRSTHFPPKQSCAVVSASHCPCVPCMHAPPLQRHRYLPTHILVVTPACSVMSNRRQWYHQRAHVPSSHHQHHCRSFATLRAPQSMVSSHPCGVASMNRFKIGLLYRLPHPEATTQVFHPSPTHSTHSMLCRQIELRNAA